MGITRALLAVPVVMVVGLGASCDASRTTARPDPLASAHLAADPGPRGAVLTQRGSLDRLGWYVGETRLTVESVASPRFGKVADLPVDGKIYAQPLYVPGVDVTGSGHRDIVIVATEHDSVYAFDATATATATATAAATGRGTRPLWHTSLLAPGARPMLAATDRVAGGRLCDSIVPEVGITSTPVIDWATGTLYAVALDVEAGRLTYRIHAIDIRTGLESRPSTVISASVTGKGLDSAHGTVTFDPTRAQQRMGLTLVGGIVYAGFASFCGWGIYHGWILGYRAADLSRAIVYNSSPDAYGGGFWESESGITVDGHGHLIVVTGNGPFMPGPGATAPEPAGVTAPEPAGAAGDSVLEMSPEGGTLRVVDEFTPFDQECRNRHDRDLGSGSPLAVPGHGEYLLSSKTGAVYVLDATHLGGYAALTNACQQEGRTDVDRIRQELTVDSVPGGMWGTWGYWRSSATEYVYSSGAGGHLTQWRLDADGRLDPNPIAQAPESFAFPGAIPVVSSNGSTPGTGVVWTVDSPDQGRATLRAYDAANIAHEIWNSGTGIAALDESDGLNHFQVPTIAAGLVFVGGRDHLEVYGLSP